MAGARRGWLLVLTAGVAAILAACGAQPFPSPRGGSPGASPSATASPSAPVSPTPPAATPTATAAPTAGPSSTPASTAHAAVVLLDPAGPTVRFVRDDGTALGSHTLAATAPSSPYLASTTAAGRLWYVASTGGRLHSVAPDGTDTEAAVLPDAAPGVVDGLAVSPDGRQWAWGVVLSNPTRIRVDAGGIGMSTRTSAAEQADNQALIPLGWTDRGILVSRAATGIGGCCYLTPESAGRDALLMDPVSLAVTRTWTGCATAYVDAAGWFACAAPSGAVTVHRPPGPDVTVTVTAATGGAGWAIADAVGNRVLFGVIHSRGDGGGTGPYVIDTEAADLATSNICIPALQVVPNGVLPDGRIVVTGAPAVVGSSPETVSALSADGSMQTLGTAGLVFAGLVTLPG